MLPSKLLVICSLLCATTFSSGADKVVSVATLEDYAPFCFTDDNVKNGINDIFPPGTDTKKFKGYSWDVLRESFHAMGYSIILSVTPWSRAMEYVKVGQADVLFPAGKSVDRQKVFYYSRESLNSATYVVYVRTDSPVKWKGLESLKGLTIGEKRRFSHGDKWKATSYIDKHPINTILQGFRMLDLKRFDGFVGYQFNWDYALKQVGWDSKFRKLPSFDSSDEYLIALKSNPLALQILKDYDLGKKRLIETGKFSAIRRKWGFKREHSNNDLRQEIGSKMLVQNTAAANTY